MPEPKPEYPTPEQIDEVWAAWKKDGKEGILKYLHALRKKNEVQPRSADAPESDL